MTENTTTTIEPQTSEEKLYQNLYDNLFSTIVASDCLDMTRLDLIKELIDFIEMLDEDEDETLST